ncbi:AMP-binding protein [Paracoccus sp. MBLB3053]|uniref:AMP-binding protein n=1 Tax=Paracoccus aurantius TaxID=3073814 RepID=A0ABU2HY21_9RHOB|nr:AMP-binding protein [Paracoccus sp. MBLB3053]MDS9469957.1 AMP-binding protein [Paracoccus sp. MBLB3053]
MSQPYRTVSAELAGALTMHRDRVALRDRGLRLTYGELAAFVAACRVPMAGQRAVALYGAPGALFGATAATAVIAGCPFVHLDPAMPNSVLANILDELEIGLVIVSQTPRDGQLPAGCQVLDASTFLGAPATAATAPAEFPPSHPIYLVATSGTTGRPKCIPVTHDAAFLSYEWRDAYTPYLPGMKVGCYIFAIWEMFRPLRNGGEVCFPGIEDLLSPQALATFMADHDLHEMLFTPSFFEKMLQGLDAERAASLPLRRIILNGEVVSDRLIREAQAKLPDVALWNLYSICETHDICMSRVTGPASRAEGVSVGKAMPHLRAIVLDDNDLPGPSGTPGLLHFAGPRMLGPGYVNRPEETARRFRDLTIEGRELRLYDTGDQGFVEPDGEIVVLGRVAHMLKLRGHSIQTRELTETMAGLLGFSHAIPWVQQVGEQGQALVFYYTADARQTASNSARWPGAGETARTPEALAAALRAVLPAYCVPSYLVQLDEIPIHEVSGKCNYKALPAISPQIGTDAGASDALPVVAQAARIICCGETQIDPSRSFHDHGGDSLMCVDFIVSLERDYDTRVDFDWALNLPLARLHDLLSARETAKPVAAFDRPGILLTGATGFLGRHVLAEAVRLLPEGQVVYCLVRPRDDEAAQRLDATAAELDIPQDRVVLVAGSMDAAEFGLAAADYAALCQQVFRVIHCAAIVNLAVDRAQMEQWSRIGIAAVLDFCRNAKADLRFSSSNAVFPEEGGPHPEAPAADFAACSGYGAAKIAAERQIEASGLPALIVRLPSLYDMAAPNPKDICENILAACRASQSLPAGLCFPMTDVRAAAAFLVHAAAPGAVEFCNLIADDPLTARQGMEAFETLPAETWLARAPLAEPVRKLIAAAPSTLHANARFRNEAAKAHWCKAGLGAFDRICDAPALLDARLGYQREPALT